MILQAAGQIRVSFRKLSSGVGGGGGGDKLDFGVRGNPRVSPYETLACGHLIVVVLGELLWWLMTRYVEYLRWSITDQPIFRILSVYHYKS